MGFHMKKAKENVTTRLPTHLKQNICGGIHEGAYAFGYKDMGVFMISLLYFHEKAYNNLRF